MWKIPFLFYSLVIFGSLFFQEAYGKGGVGGQTRTNSDGKVGSYNAGLYFGIIGAIIFLGIAGCCLYFIFCYKTKGPLQTTYSKQYNGGPGQPIVATQNPACANTVSLVQVKAESTDIDKDPQGSNRNVWTTPNSVAILASAQTFGVHRNYSHSAHSKDNVNVKANGYNQATPMGNNSKRALPYL